MLESLDEHELLVFWSQLLVLVVVARLLGTLMRSIGLPSVIGELGAGLILGPSVFGRVWESGFEELFPGGEAQSAALLAVSWLGVALLLIVTGFETDLALIRKLGLPAASVTGFSLVVPLFGGLAVGYLLPGEFVGEESSRLVFALFVAAALSVSSLAVIAKILGELGLMRRDFGQITVAAGMANDVIGWLMLAIFAGLASSGEVSAVEILTTVAGLVLFVIVAFTVGQRIVDLALRAVRRDGSNVNAALTIAIVTALAFGVATQALGIEAVLGTFVAGVVLHRSRFQQPEVLEHIEGLTVTFLAPVFFATAGLRVDLGLLAKGDALKWSAVVVLVAIVAKFLGAYVGARVAGLSHRAGAALGAGLNARGALEIVIATVGLSLHVLNDTAYTMIVLVPMVTSVFASVTLRAVVRGWRGSPDEVERLEREEALSKNVVVTPERVLLPSRGGPASIAAAQVLHFSWPPEAPISVISIGSKHEDMQLEPVKNVLWERSVDIRTIAGDNFAAQVLQESKLGYGAITLGVAIDHETGLLSPDVDEILAHATIPVMIVRRARNLERPLPAAFERAVVPVTGSRSSRAAQEVAFSISDDLGTELLLTHVVNREPVPIPRVFQRGASGNDRSELAEKLLEDAEFRAAESGASARRFLREGISTVDTMIDAVESSGADLVVLGARVRNVDGRPFLGHNVESVLERCNATVVVVATPIISSD